MNADKGSLVAPLFFAALALACVGSRLGIALPWALTVLALAVAGWAGSTGRASLSLLALAVLSYSALVALSALVFSPAYTPAGLYHPLLLVVAFFVARRFTEDAEKRAALSAVALGAILAAWGLVQLGSQGVPRAHAFFETPSAYAASLNLLLVPLLAAALAGRRNGLTVSGVIALSAALFAADSRGGLLALAAGSGAATILAGRAQLLRPRGLVLALALVAAGSILAAALRSLPSSHATELPTASVRAESSVSRLELYALSWSAWREHSLLGSGYLTFGYTLEKGRAKVPSYGDSSETSFVHNDYLQTLLELGPLGLAALLALTWLPPWIAYRGIPVLREDQRVVVVATSSALVAMAVHALVDFPFYIPICLVLYGLLLGALDRQVRESVQAPAPSWYPIPWLRAARAGAILITLIFLLRPVVAETVAERGLRNAAVGKGQSAALLLGAARRIEPADWRYYWYEGQFWDAQANDSGKREAAQLAAEAYAAGVHANPLEIRNLLGKISVHRRYRALLDAPADRSTLQAWLAQAEALAPLNPEVRRARQLLEAMK